MAGVNPCPVPVHRALPRTKSTQHLLLHTNGYVNDQAQETGLTVGSRLSPTTAHELQDLHDARRLLVKVLQMVNLRKANHGNLPLRHDRGVNRHKPMRTSGSESAFM